MKQIEQLYNNQDIYGLIEEEQKSVRIINDTRENIAFVISNSALIKANETLIYELNYLDQIREYKQLLLINIEGVN